MSFKNQIKKIISISVLTTFFATNIFANAPTLVTAGASSKAFGLEIPLGLGSIDKVVFAKNDAPLIVHIQEAHSNYDAQKNIQAILEHLYQSYGINLVLMEGAGFQLDPDFFVFSEDEAVQNKINKALMSAGEMTGAEAFLMKHPDAVQGWGVENPEEYKKNLELYREVFSKRKIVETFLNKIYIKWQKSAGEKLNKNLREFLTEKTAYEDGKITLTDWVERLKKTYSSELEKNLADISEQINYPALTRYFKIKSEKNPTSQKLEEEKEQFLNDIRLNIKNEGFENPKVVADIEKVFDLASRNELPIYETRFIFERLVDASPADFSFDAYPNLKVFIQKMILTSEIDIETLQTEIERLIKEIEEKLIKTNDEKNLVQNLNEYSLIKKALRLEMSRREYDLLREEKLSIVKLAQIDLSLTREAEFQSVKETFSNALKFYEGAIERENFMAENVFSRLKELGETKTILITGGFHTEGFQKAFQKNYASYIGITPKISEVSFQDKKNYLTALLGRKSVSGSYIAPTVRSDIRFSQAQNPENWRRDYALLVKQIVDNVGQINPQLVEYVLRKLIDVDYESKFLGTFLLNLDGKNRITIPAEFRKAIGSESTDALVALYEEKNKRVRVFTQKIWDRNIARDLPENLEERQKYLDKKNGNAYLLMPDSAGRVILTKLLEATNLKDEKEWILKGAGDSFFMYPKNLVSRSENRGRQTQPIFSFSEDDLKDERGTIVKFLEKKNVSEEKLRGTLVEFKIRASGTVYTIIIDDTKGRQPFIMVDSLSKQLHVEGVEDLLWMRVVKENEVAWGSLRDEVRSDENNRSEQRIVAATYEELDRLASEFSAKGIGYSDLNGWADEMVKTKRSPFENEHSLIEVVAKTEIEKLAGSLSTDNMDVLLTRIPEASRLLREIARRIEVKSIFKRVAATAETLNWQKAVFYTTQLASFEDIFDETEKTEFQKIKRNAVEGFAAFRKGIFKKIDGVSAVEEKRAIFLTVYDEDYADIWNDISRVVSEQIKDEETLTLLDTFVLDVFGQYLQESANERAWSPAIFKNAGYKIYLEKAIKRQNQKISGDEEFVTSTDLITAYPFRYEKGPVYLLVFDRGWFGYPQGKKSDAAKVWGRIQGGPVWKGLLPGVGTVRIEDAGLSAKYGSYSVGDITQRGLDVGIPKDVGFQALKITRIDTKERKELGRVGHPFLLAVLDLSQGHLFAGKQNNADFIAREIQKAQEMPGALKELLQEISGLPRNVAVGTFARGMRAVMSFVTFLEPSLLDEMKNWDFGYYSQLKKTIESEKYKGFFKDGKALIRKTDPTSGFAMSRKFKERNLFNVIHFSSEPYNVQDGKAWFKVLDLSKSPIQNSSTASYVVVNALRGRIYGIRSGDSFYHSKDGDGWTVGVPVNREGANGRDRTQWLEAVRLPHYLKYSIEARLEKENLKNGVDAEEFQAGTTLLPSEKESEKILEIFNKAMAEFDRRLRLGRDEGYSRVGNENAIDWTVRKRDAFGSSGNSIVEAIVYRADVRARKNEENIPSSYFLNENKTADGNAGGSESSSRFVTAEVTDGLASALANPERLAADTEASNSISSKGAKTSIQNAVGALGLEVNGNDSFILGADLALAKGKGLLALAKTIYAGSSFVILEKDRSQIESIKKIIAAENLQNRVEVFSDATEAVKFLAKNGISLKAMISSDELALAEELTEALREKPIVVNEKMINRFLNLAGTLFKSLAEKLASDFVIAKSA